MLLYWRLDLMMAIYIISARKKGDNKLIQQTGALVEEAIA
jgi:hypothetical protein